MTERPGAAEQAVSAPLSSAKPGRPGGDEVLEHEYDGIREYDNPLPGWWVKILWGSVFFSIAYGFHYHVSRNGASVEDSYAAEVAEANQLQAKRALAENVSEEGLGKLMLDAPLMVDAKTLFGQRCSPCHGESGQGVIGPNLTDNHWLHGAGTLLDLHKLVSEGVPEKGMPAWRMQLTPVQLRQLAAFVGTLRGKNLPGKPAEGPALAGP